MPYVYQCDGFCETDTHSKRPALTGEFNEHWYNEGDAGDRLRQEGYEPGDLVTLCPKCVLELLLHR